MTKHEAAVISAYTRCLMGSFSDLHEYIEKLLGRPVWTHELADEGLWLIIKEASKDEFLAINAALS